MKLTFVEWLETELLKRGMNKKQLADRINFSPALVYQVAMGDRKPSAEFMIACAVALSADPVAVLRMAGILPRAAGDTDDPQVAEMWTLLQQVPPDARVWVIRMLRGLVE